MEPLTEANRVNNLLDGLRPELNRTIIESARIPETREDLIDMATDMQQAWMMTTAWRESTQRAKDKGRESWNKDPPHQGRDDDSVKRDIFAGASRERPRRFEGTCFNCGRKGHKEAACRSRRRSPTSKDAERTPKAKAQST